jgi:hypothetical protein
MCSKNQLIARTIMIFTIHFLLKTERGIFHSKELSKFSVDYEFKYKQNN